MKIAIRYQSRGGNTKEVAEAIAKAAGITAESIENPIVEYVDLLFIGGGVYKWGIDSSLINYLGNLDPGLVKSVAAFTTAGGMDKTKTILSIVEGKGINAEKETLPIKMGIRNHAWLGGKGSIKLNEKQIHSINKFVKACLKS
ncbi:MAG: flavoprotein [Clostridiales bacterium]|jgi:flavodoxin|nr:flavoprotein [Clostridiales bacterium]